MEGMDSLRTRLITERGNKPNTADLIVAALRNLNGGDFTSLAFLEDVDSICAKIDKYAESTQVRRLSMIMAVLEKGALYDRYRAVFDVRNAALLEAKEARDGALTEKETASWMTWPQIMEYHAAMKTGTPTEVTNHLAVSLYVLQPPRRAMDYHKMWIVTGSPGTDMTKNYYVRSTRKMYFNEFKTVKTQGQQVIDVPAELAAIIQKARPTDGPLFTAADGGPLKDPSAMTKILNKAFGRKVSVNILRHSYVSSLYNPAIAKIGKTASAMAHSVGMHASYYRSPAGGAGGS